MKSLIRQVVLGAGLALVTLPVSQAAISTVSTQKLQDRFENKIRHELVMLPYFGVFDNLSFTVEGSHVILSGQVTRPTLKSDAERVVKRIEGVESVTNEIEVLPPSPMDDQIRLAEYRAILGYSTLSRYSWGPVPPIHIIVKNGHVTLEGAVNNETDKNVATIRANGVSGVFSVENNLRVDKKVG